jgi:chromosomal replication initiation ATPase DnaA
MHSIPVVKDFICKHYKVTEDQIKSPSRKYDLVKSRQMLILLCGSGRDNEIAEIISRDRTTAVIARKTAKGNMQFNRSLKSEFERLKVELLKYEIS